MKMLNIPPERVNVKGGAIALGFQLVTIVLLLVQGLIIEDGFRSAIPFLMTLVIIIPGLLFLATWLRSRRQPAIEEG